MPKEELKIFVRNVEDNVGSKEVKPPASVEAWGGDHDFTYIMWKDIEILRYIVG